MMALYSIPSSACAGDNKGSIQSILDSIFQFAGVSRANFLFPKGNFSGMFNKVIFLSSPFTTVYCAGASGNTQIEPEPSKVSNAIHNLIDDMTPALQKVSAKFLLFVLDVCIIITCSPFLFVDLSLVSED